jgi:hypothetical protein
VNRGLANYTFLTLGLEVERSNVYEGPREADWKGVSNIQCLNGGPKSTASRLCTEGYAESVMNASLLRLHLGIAFPDIS